jgi:hypothetical protein
MRGMLIKGLGILDDMKAPVGPWTIESIVNFSI